VFAPLSPTFPPGLADVLASVFPESARPRARRIIDERLLPAMAVGASPGKERKIATAAAELLERRISEAEGLVTLEAVTVEQEAQAWQRRSLQLAVERYAVDHPEVSYGELPPPWSNILGLSGDDASAVADTARKELTRFDRWEAKVEGGSLSKPTRLERLFARTNFATAIGGDFSSAPGPLSDFLAAVGASYERLRFF
jgi:hypothetical protein